MALEEVGGAAGCGAEEDVGETEGFLDAPSSVEGNALESEYGEVGSGSSGSLSRQWGHDASHGCRECFRKVNYCCGHG